MAKKVKVQKLYPPYPLHLSILDLDLFHTQLGQRSLVQPLEKEGMHGGRVSPPLPCGAFFIEMGCRGTVCFLLF